MTDIRVHLNDIANQVHELYGLFFTYTGLIKHNKCKFLKYGCIQERIRTFEKWPIASIQKPEKLAEAGFFYSGMGDRVVCFHCGVNLAFWTVNDNPDGEHKMFASKCQFMLFKDKTHDNIDTHKCAICLENSSHYAIVPCGHQVACHECLLKCNRCPMCNGKILALLRIFK